MQILRSHLKIILLIGITVWLIACGGGGGGGGGGGSDGGNKCGTVIDIGLNDIADGVLEAGDCRVDDIFPGTGNDNFVDEYRVTLSTGAYWISP